MARITDISQRKRLQEYGINIKTKYWDRNSISERNTDCSRNDNVLRGIRIEKSYFQNGRELFRVNSFDSRILYSFVVSGEDGERFVCPNCGAEAVENSMEEGCPYCGTFFNIDYDSKSVGVKQSYDYVVRSRGYRAVVLAASLAVSVLAMFVYILVTGRTFNGYDIGKALLIGGALGTVVFFAFYYCDTFSVLAPVRWYKEKLNKRQMEFWNRMYAQEIEKNRFFNNFNYELSNYLYRVEPDVIDYDIIDYDSFREEIKNGRLRVKVTIFMRLVRYRGGGLRVETGEREFTLEYIPEEAIRLDGDAKIIRCRGCGASINAAEGTCGYCGTVNNFFQQWYFV